MGNIRQSTIAAPTAAFITIKLASVLFSLSLRTAESFLSSQYFLSQSRNSLHFTQTENSLPPPKEPPPLVPILNQINQVQVPILILEDTFQNHSSISA